MLLCHMMILLTWKRVTVRCDKGTILELRGDTARMFGSLDNTSVRASDKKKNSPLPYPKLKNQYFNVYSNIIKSQYDCDFFCSQSLYCYSKGRTWKSYCQEQHYVLLKKRIFDMISKNIRDEAGDSVTFEHGKVIITLHFKHSNTQYFI